MVSLATWAEWRREIPPPCPRTSSVRSCEPDAGGESPGLTGQCQRAWFKSHWCYLPAEWHWTGHLTSLHLSFLLCKMGTLMVSDTYIVQRMNRQIVERTGSRVVSGKGGGLTTVIFPVHCGPAVASASLCLTPVYVQTNRGPES